MADNSTKSENPTLLHGKYELSRVLGKGTFAKVYHAKNLQMGKNVAMKVVRKEKVIRVKMMEQIKREISVMKMVKHPNIVELHEVMASKSRICIAMELVCGGELFSKVARGRLREDVARIYNHQIIKGCSGTSIPERLVGLYKQMAVTGVILDGFTYMYVLSACASLGMLREGEQIHVRVLVGGYCSNVFVRTNLINWYAMAGAGDDTMVMHVKCLIKWTREVW